MFCLEVADTAPLPTPTLVVGASVEVRVGRVVSVFAGSKLLQGLARKFCPPLSFFLMLGVSSGLRRGTSPQEHPTGAHSTSFPSQEHMENSLGGD